MFPLQIKRLMETVKHKTIMKKYSFERMSDKKVICIYDTDLEMAKKRLKILSGKFKCVKTELI